jgi:tetratricopeptide (TPR) repeat protein
LVAAGRLAGAEERMASALEIAQKWPYEEEMVRGLQIELLLMLNKLASAAPLVTALEVLGLERRSAPLQATAARWRAELACREGSIDAVAAANRALSLAEGPVLAVCARRLLALALFQAGEKQDSMRQATQALADAKRYGFKPQAVEALQILGDLAIERGDDAIDYFTEMAALASQMGAPFALARAKYGQAALRPEAPGASELVKVARQSLSDVLRTLNEADRRDISSTPTLATVLTKDLPDPVAKPRPQAPAISNWLLKSSGQE